MTIFWQVYRSTVLVCGAQPSAVMILISWCGPESNLASPFEFDAFVLILSYFWSSCCWIQYVDCAQYWYYHGWKWGEHQTFNGCMGCPLSLCRLLSLMINPAGGVYCYLVGPWHEGVCQEWATANCATSGSSSFHSFMVLGRKKNCVLVLALHFTSFINSCLWLYLLPVLSLDEVGVFSETDPHGWCCFAVKQPKSSCWIGVVSATS